MSALFSSANFRPGARVRVSFSGTQRGGKVLRHTKRLIVVQLEDTRIVRFCCATGIEVRGKTPRPDPLNCRAVLLTEAQAAMLEAA